MIRGAVKKQRSNKPFMVIGFFIIVIGLWKVFPLPQKEIELVQADQQEVVQVQTRSAQQIIQDTDYSYVIEAGDVLSSVFTGKDVPFSEIVGLEQIQSEIFSFNSVQVGKEIFVRFTEASSDFRLADIYYQPDSTRVIHAKQTSGGWTLEALPIIYDMKEAIATGTVESSLYLSGLAQGIKEGVILEFADMFAWDIDFALQTRSGDSYKILYEEKHLDGQVATTGRVLAGEYINAGTSFKAFYFRVNDIPGYYDEEGNALQKAFLKAPVNYRYVTSGFSSARFHPTLKTVMPHNGVDYAAAYGTPIISVADGIVSKSGWMGAYGNRIEVKHGDRYGSQYSHMSSYAGLAVGTAVKQGEVIGYVGSTGASTGNHVHFSITDRGGYVNPETIDVPDGEPVPEALKTEYLQMVQERLDQLTSNN